MQRGHVLHFDCIECRQGIDFSILMSQSLNTDYQCQHCGKVYRFEDQKLKDQLIKFEKLCRQIIESREILSETSVGVQVGDETVKIPYKILLTRFNSFLDLTIEGRPVSIEFRIEPIKDLTASDPSVV